jgi:hypothetical protein
LQNAPKHDLRIDEIFGAAEADHADLRFCGRSGIIVHFKVEKRSTPNAQHPIVCLRRSVLGVERSAFTFSL